MNNKWMKSTEIFDNYKKDLQKQEQTRFYPTHGKKLTKKKLQN